MPDVSNKNLIKTRDGIAPQYYDDREDEFKPLSGRDGALYYVDLNRTKEHFGYSADVKPSEAKKGDSFLEFDTGDVYIYDGALWVVM